ncbi:hypothetical protein AB3N59_14700 [Leptospira sp. WS92.C1]
MKKRNILIQITKEYFIESDFKETGRVLIHPVLLEKKENSSKYTKRKFGSNLTKIKRDSIKKAGLFVKPKRSVEKKLKVEYLTMIQSLLF